MISRAILSLLFFANSSPHELRYRPLYDLTRTLRSLGTAIFVRFSY